VQKQNLRAAELEDLVREIEQEVAETAAYTGCERLRPAVRAALATVRRHLFVPRMEVDWAYANRPLPIGYRQTISQPYIVAIMTELAEVQEGDKVLEIGTGSGYQAAVLAELGAQVISLEVVPELAREARERLAKLGYDSVTVVEGDGRRGWPAQAPYDAILVTAAGDRVPQALLEQLAAGGRLVMPVRASSGEGFGLFTALTGQPGQVLRKLVKRSDGRIETRDLLPVAFVPLVGED
jgi:protein-L-isoaspartate(D-aspartate) O-methyltransferase